MSLRLVAKLDGDGAGFERMMTNAHSKVKRFGSEAIAPLKNMIAGAFSVGAITALTRKTIQLASTIRDTSARLGVGVEWLQEMEFAAIQTGSSVEHLTTMMEQLARARDVALKSPEGQQAQDFAKFGITQSDLRTKSNQDLVGMIAKSFESGSTQELQGAFLRIGGRGAGALIAGFSEGIEALQKQARDAGAVMSEDILTQLADIGDQFTTLGRVLLVETGPAIIWVVEKLRDAIGNLKLSAAFLGGFTANMGMKEGVKFLANPVTYLFSEAGKQSRKAGKDAFVDEVNRQADVEHARQEAIRKAAANRKKKAANFFDFDDQPKDVAKVAAPKLKELPKGGDELVRVGNFLGTGIGNSIVAVGEITNNLLRQHTNYLKQISANTVPRETSTDIGVPST